MTSAAPTASVNGEHTKAMRQGRQADSARRRQRVTTALERATAEDTEISASAIARAAGGNVGRFGAAAVGDGDLPDGVAGMFGVQQRLRVAPDPVAVPVETHRGHGVHGGSAAVFTDPVVAAGDV